MTREAITYGERRAFSGAEGFSPDEPVAGFYRFRFRRGAHPVGIRIWFGPPHDPETGEEMDRSHRWQAEANGEYVELDRVWPRCAREPIDQGEHDHLVSLQRWGEENVPEGPQANPHKAVDLLTAPLPF